MDKEALTPQPHDLIEIYQYFINMFLATKNWPAAYTAARKLTAENRAYYSQFSYENPPPINQKPPKQL